jgi:insulysin
MRSWTIVRPTVTIIRAYPLYNRSISMSLEKPLCDSREYDQIRLSNGIIATLIRDITLARSSCALAVNVGASADPVDFPGLAHFTEHMLFLGTEKYPKENHYKDFLNSNGGSSNASTSMEQTVYKFDVNHSQFAPSIDIFSHFFRNPLLGANSAGREIKAVDAEDAKNRTVDGRRTLQILKCLIHPSSAYCKYSTGNIHTLAKGDADSNSEYVREAMVKFYERWYRSEQMGVALVGPQSLAELKSLAVENFSDIRHRVSSDVFASADKVYIAGSGDHAADSAPASPSPEPTYPFKTGGVAVYTNPVAEINRVDILWGMPSIE